MTIRGAESLDDGEDVVVDVVAALAVGDNIEDLGKSELLRAVHAEVAGDEDQNAALEGAFLNVRVHVGVLDIFEGHGLDLFINFLESDVGGAGVGHLADLLIEVDESSSLLSRLLHHFEVFFQEHVGNLFGVHLRSILIQVESRLFSNKRSLLAHSSFLQFSNQFSSFLTPYKPSLLQILCF